MEHLLQVYLTAPGLHQHRVHTVISNCFTAFYNYGILGSVRYILCPIRAIGESKAICLDGISFVESSYYFFFMSVGANYNIPVCLWLMDTHPYNPPIVFVRPTATMQIKQGKHVDANGKIYLPYLHEWKHVRVFYIISS